MLVLLVLVSSSLLRDSPHGSRRDPPATPPATRHATHPRFDPRPAPRQTRDPPRDRPATHPATCPATHPVRLAARHTRGPSPASANAGANAFSLDCQFTEDGPPLRLSMDFWFMPVDEFMRMPVDKPLPRHQELRDMGLLVKRKMTVEDVMSGRFAADTAAVSHRWLTPEHFDPECAKIQKLRQVMLSNPSIQFLWVDWVCAPQWHGGGRTDEEEEEFRLILENILPFIFLGCTVIVLYERIYNQRFWPNVECWISTKMPTEDGLVPASEDRLRMKVYGIESTSGRDELSQMYVMGTWHTVNAQQAIEALSKNDILVTNARDKEVNLKAAG